MRVSVCVCVCDRFKYVDMNKINNTLNILQLHKSETLSEI